MSDEKISLDNFLKKWFQSVIEETVRQVVKNELNAFFEERFKNDNGSIQSVHNNIDELRNVRLKALQDSINQLQNNQNYFNQELQKLQAALSNLEKPDGVLEKISGTVVSLFKSNKYDVQRLQKENSEISGELNNKKSELGEIQTELVNLRNFSNTEITRLQNEIKKLSGELNSKKSELGETQTELSNLRTNSNAEISRLQNEIEKLSGELDNKKSELERTQQELSEKNSKLNDTQSELSTARNHLDSLNSKLNSTEAELQNALTTSQETAKKLGAWKNSADIYSPVRDAILKCPTFSSIVEKYGLNDTSETGLLIYAQAMGKINEDFVFEIWTAAVESKKRSREFMTPEESEVYSALNKVYRQIWNIDFDIFTLPGGQSLAETFQPTNFDSNVSIYLAMPRNKDLPYTTGIYVPILMNRENKQAQKSYVEAGNRK